MTCSGPSPLRAISHDRVHSCLIERKSVSIAATAFVRYVILPSLQSPGNGHAEAEMLPGLSRNPNVSLTSLSLREIESAAIEFKISVDQSAT